MSDTPTQCQFCGADIELLDNGKPCRDSDGNWVAFRCLTSWHRGDDNTRRFQSKPCEETERQNLYARIKRLEEAGDNLLTVMRGEEAAAYCEWIALAHDAELNWRKAKEAKP